MLGVRGNQYVMAGRRQVTVAALAESLTKRSWHTITIAVGSKGPSTVRLGVGGDQPRPGPEVATLAPGPQESRRPQRSGVLHRGRAGAHDTNPARQDSRGAVVDRRRTKQTTPQGQGGGEPACPVTIDIAVLLELAAWCRHRLTDPPGEIACPTPLTPSPLLPPAPDGPAAIDSGAPVDPASLRQEAAAPRPARQAARPSPRGKAPRGGRS